MARIDEKTWRLMNQYPKENKKDLIRPQDLDDWMKRPDVQIGPHCDTQIPGLVIKEIRYWRTANLTKRWWHLSNKRRTKWWQWWRPVDDGESLVLATGRVKGFRVSDALASPANTQRK